MRWRISLMLALILSGQVFLSPFLAGGSADKVNIAARSQQKPKNKMSVEKKLERIFRKRGYKDPMVPALMHGLKRYLDGAPNPNQFDRVVADNLRKYQITRSRIETMVKSWDLIGSQLKAQWFPKEMLSLEPKRALDLNLFARLVRDAAGRFGQPRGGIPVSRNLPGLTPPPQITEARPAGIDFTLVLRPGVEFTLVGRNFSATAAENRIQIGRVRAGTGTVELDVLHEVTPTSATTTQLRAIAPRELRPGSDYNVRVVVNRTLSNLWPAYVETPPAPAARLDSISPGPCQYPGQRAVLRGDNFSAESLVELEFLDADLTAGDLRTGYRDVRVGRPSVDFRSRNEIYFQIPQETWPGDYSFGVINPGAASSLHQTFNVCAPSYRIELDHIYCRDESDPEFWEDDEVAVIAKSNADGGAFSNDVATDEISGFSDRTRKPRTGSFRGITLFSNGGASVPVKYMLTFDYTLVEADDYDKAEAIALVSALGGIADGAIAIIGAIAGATAVTIGAITGGVAIVVGIVIVAILLDSNGYDVLGGQVDVYTAQYLQTHTAAADSLSFQQTVNFPNDDDTGSYDMTYRIVRVRE
jgi:hypothetical protein